GAFSATFTSALGGIGLRVWAKSGRATISEKAEMSGCAGGGALGDTTAVLEPSDTEGGSGTKNGPTMSSNAKTAPSMAERPRRDPIRCFGAVISVPAFVPAPACSRKLRSEPANRATALRYRCRRKSPDWSRAPYPERTDTDFDPRWRR